jgi:hypothetical protein
LGSIVAGVPADLTTIAAMCLERRPEARDPSAVALVKDLERFLDGRPILARPAGPVERLHKWARRRPALAALCATTLAAVLVLAGGTLYHLRRFQVAAMALVASHDRVVEAQARARQSFERLSDTAAERFLSRGAALDDADRDHLRRISDEYRHWPLEPDPVTAARFKTAGLLRVAELFDRLHWLPDALETARGARDCLDDLAALGVVTPDDEAATVARDALARLTRRLADGDSTAGSQLAVAWADLATIEAMTGHGDESLALHRRAVDLLDRLLADKPDDVDLASRALPV